MREGEREEEEEEEEGGRWWEAPDGWLLASERRLGGKGWRNEREEDAEEVVGWGLGHSLLSCGGVLAREEGGRGVGR